MDHVEELAKRLEDFLEDVDFYDYRDRMSSGQTKEDMIDETIDSLGRPARVAIMVGDLEELYQSRTFDGYRDADQMYERCDALIKDLKNHYMENFASKGKEKEERRQGRHGRG